MVDMSDIRVDRHILKPGETTCDSATIRPPEGCVKPKTR
jgi:hypothetical protein